MLEHNFASRVSKNDEELSSDEFREYLQKHPCDFDVRYIFSIFLRKRLAKIGDKSSNYDMIKNLILASIFIEGININHALIEILILTEDFEVALMLIDKSIGVEGNNAYLFYSKGYSLMKTGKFSESLIFFRKSLSIEDSIKCNDAIKYVEEILESSIQDTY